MEDMVCMSHAILASSPSPPSLPPLLLPPPALSVSYPHAVPFAPPYYSQFSLTHQRCNFPPRFPPINLLPLAGLIAIQCCPCLPPYCLQLSITHRKCNSDRRRTHSTRPQCPLPPSLPPPPPSHSSSPSCFSCPSLLLQLSIPHLKCNFPS